MLTFVLNMMNCQRFGLDPNAAMPVVRSIVANEQLAQSGLSHGIQDRSTKPDAYYHLLKIYKYSGKYIGLLNLNTNDKKSFAFSSLYGYSLHVMRRTLLRKKDQKFT